MASASKCGGAENTLLSSQNIKFMLYIDVPPNRSVSDRRPKGKRWKKSGQVIFGAESRQIFFIRVGWNPLKRLDSEK
jgi:hypothetical protein